MKNIQLDKPVDKEAQDKFQRFGFSKRIAGIISKPQIEKSLVVGIYGKWGEGKTTVMNFIRTELPKETIVVNFNPWLFSDEQHLLKSFFAEIAESLGKSDKTLKEKFGTILSDYAGAIGTLTQVAGISLDGAKEFGEKLKSTSTEKIKKRIDDIIIKSKKNIVVFIDDIDRLDVEEIQYIFKVVKLVGDFPNTCYVLSFDDEMVSSALAPKYGNKAENAGYQFLEKIIQVPLKIPKANKDALRAYTIALINNSIKDISAELSEKDASEFVQAFNLAFMPLIDNPRMGLRYSNTLTFSIPLLVGEVNISDLMVIEGLKVFYPDLYDFMRSNSRYFLTGGSDNSRFGTRFLKKDEIKSTIENIIKHYPQKKKEIIIELLEKLFPQLKSVFHNVHYSDETYDKWLLQKRVCSPSYFDRYFSYVVLEGEISDVVFEQFIELLKNSTHEIISAKLKELVGLYSASGIIFRLKSWEKKLDKDQSRALAFALAENGHSFTLEKDFHFATTYAQGARMIARTVKEMAKEKRLSEAIEILSLAKSLEYSMEINDWLMDQREDHPEDAAFTNEDQAIIRDILISRFITQLKEVDLFSIFPDTELWRILEWWTESKTKHDIVLSEFLEFHLTNDKEFALRLLKVFTPTVISTSSSEIPPTRTYKAGFFQKNFDRVDKVVGSEILNKYIIEQFGMNPSDKEPSSISDRDLIDDKTLVSVFQWFIVHKESSQLDMPINS